MPVTCPKCGHQQEAGDECARCGVLFAKVEAPGRAGAPPRPAPPPSAPPAGRRAPVLAWLIPALAVALLWVWLWRPAETPPAVAAVSPPAPAMAAMAAVAEPAPREAADPAQASPYEPAPDLSADLSGEDAGSFAMAAPAPPPPAPAIAPPILSDEWYEGSTGFARALEDATGTGQPVLVYFYTDWCPYCRELDGELLTDPRVMTYLREVIKVRINPERSARDREVARVYGITGFPSLFLHPRGRGPQRRVERRIHDAEGWRLKSPREFVAALRSMAG